MSCQAFPERSYPLQSPTSTNERELLTLGKLPMTSYDWNCIDPTSLSPRTTSQHGRWLIRAGRYVLAKPPGPYSYSILHQADEPPMNQLAIGFPFTTSIHACFRLGVTCAPPGLSWRVI